MIGEELDEIWAAEAALPGQGPYRGRRLRQVPGVEVYAGLDQERQRRFVALRMDAALKRFVSDRYPRSSAGILVETTYEEGGASSVFLREQAGVPGSVFRSVVADVLTVAASDRAPKSVRQAFERFAVWQKALQRRVTLTAAEVRGIVGELVVLRDVLAPDLGLARALDVWKAPAGEHLHDFAGGRWELEVKSMLAPAESFHVNALGQLEPEAGNGMWLVTVELEPADDGTSLMQIVHDIKGLAGTEAPLLDALHNAVILRGAGAPAVEAEAAVRYRVAGIRCFAVGSEFPLIRRAIVLPGVRSLHYEVEMLACTPFGVQTDEMLASLRELETE